MLDGPLKRPVNVKTCPLKLFAHLVLAKVCKDDEGKRREINLQIKDAVRGLKIESARCAISKQLDRRRRLL